MGSGGGATFLYSTASVTTVDEHSTLPYDSIATDKLKIDDIVVSGDNIICRVINIDIENNLVYVTLLASGIGGAGSGRILTLKAVDSATTEWPSHVIPTMPVNARYMVTSNMSADIDAEVEIALSVDLYSTNSG
jgi:hypothetical protein